MTALRGPAPGAHSWSVAQAGVLRWAEAGMGGTKPPGGMDKCPTFRMFQNLIQSYKLDLCRGRATENDSSPQIDLSQHSSAVRLHRRVCLGDRPWLPNLCQAASRGLTGIQGRCSDEGWGVSQGRLGAMLPREHVFESACESPTVCLYNAKFVTTNPVFIEHWH